MSEKKEAYLKYLNNKNDQNKIEYNRTRALVKRYTRKLNRAHWESYISEMEHNLHGRQDRVFKFLRNLNQPTKDQVDLHIINDDQMQEYYTNLWTDSYINENVNEERYEVDWGEPDPLTMEELQETLKTTKNRKACGTDKINMELWKYAPESLHKKLLQLLNKCWKNKIIPEDWNVASVISIYKKGDRTNPENYRGISLLNTAYKIYARVLGNRLKTIADAIMLEEQSGFRKGRSCTDNIFSVKQLIEKRREHNLETHLLFVDYTKAFDRVRRNMLWAVLKKRGIPLHLIAAIQSLYKNTKIKINQNPPRSINRGVRQGCPLSACLFNLYIDDAIRLWKNMIKGGIRIDGKILNTLLYADDQILIAKSEDELQMFTHKLNIVMKGFNMQISEQKTKVMAFSGKHPIRSKILVEN